MPRKRRKRKKRKMRKRVGKHYAKQYAIKVAGSKVVDFTPSSRKALEIAKMLVDLVKNKCKIDVNIIEE